MRRSCPDAVGCALVDRGFVAVVTPRLARTARARLHGTVDGSFGAVLAAPTGRAACVRRRESTRSGGAYRGTARMQVSP